MFKAQIFLTCFKISFDSDNEFLNEERFVSIAMESSESLVKSSRAHSVATGSIFDPTALNQAQFTNLLEKFLGELPSR